jgi:hypothetical protein
MVVKQYLSCNSKVGEMFSLMNYGTKKEWLYTIIVYFFGSVIMVCLLIYTTSKNNDSWVIIIFTMCCTIGAFICSILIYFSIDDQSNDDYSKNGTNEDNDSLPRMIHK